MTVSAKEDVLRLDVAVDDVVPVEVVEGQENVCSIESGLVLG